MEGLKIGFLLIRTSVLQSKAALLVCFPPFLLLLYLALPPLETSLMPTIWHALHGVLEGPAFAFLLLNCVTVTIIASSKLGSEKRGHEEESQGHLQVLRVVEKGDKKEDGVAERVLERPSLHLDTPLEDGHGKGDDAAESIVVSASLHPDTPLKDSHDKGDEVVESIVGPSLHLDIPLKNGPDLHKKKRENLLRRSWSLNASFDVKKPNYEQVNKPSHMKERKPNIRSRARLASRRDDKVRLHPNKPLSSDLKKKQQLITSFHAADRESTHHERPNQKTNKSHRPEQAQNPAPPAGAAKHPSMDEVWATISSSKKGGDRMQEEEHSQKPDSKTVKQPQPADAATGTPTQAAVAAAALASTAAASHILLAPAAANANLLKAAYKAAPNWAAKASAAAAEKRVKGGSAEENGGDLEKLNRRAEEFIGRFNYQMRLQREESLQRRKGGCPPRNYYDVPHLPHSVHLPARSMLVG